MDERFQFLRLLFGFELQLLAREIRERQRRRRYNRRWWIRPIERPRAEKSFFLKVIEAKETDHDKFFKYTRCLPFQFDYLVNLLRPLFPQNRSIRAPLPVDFRLALTYLANGESVPLEASSFYCGTSTAYKHIPETCEAIWSVLRPLVLPMMTRDKWTDVADKFMDKWQFPNCLGAIDGKHVRVQCPPRSGSMYYNYKKYFSLVLMAACDAEYCFTWVDIGQYGSISDGGVWANTLLAQDLDNGLADIPPPRDLPHSQIKCPFAFVGDEAFPLKTYMMRPYKSRGLSESERVFNYRLSRARRVIENVFGIFAARWQIFNGLIRFGPRKAESIVKAAVCMHNFLMMTAPPRPSPEEEGGEAGVSYCGHDFVDREVGPDHVDEEGRWRLLVQNNNLRDIGRLGCFNPTHGAQDQQNSLKEYFLTRVGESQVPWQYAKAFRGMAVNRAQDE